MVLDGPGFVPSDHPLHLFHRVELLVGLSPLLAYTDYPTEILGIMNFKESKSIYLQIADRICDEILQGQYPEEERIPSVREYAATVEVNANTVMRTYDFLQNQEIIYNKRGIGYFVSPGAVQNIIDWRKGIFLSTDLPEMFRQLDTLQIPIEDIVKMYHDHKQKQ
jgi:DNA-binding transcriptional regulator YhcF (GntR family)